MRFESFLESAADNKRFDKILRDGTVKEISDFSGYPVCCIKAFEKAMDKGESPGMDWKMNPTRKFFAKTGYIPCDKCCESKTGPQLLAEIQKRRQCKTPFPELY